MKKSEFFEGVVPRNLDSWKISANINAEMIGFSIARVAV